MNWTYPSPAPINNTKELIQEYCTAIDNRLIVLLIIAGAMWLIQPLVYKMIDKIEYENIFIEEVFGKNNLKVMYKWIGLGLIFMAGYIIMVM